MIRIAPNELARLYREHAPALRLYARQWIEGGDDLVHDAFIRLAQQSPTPDSVVPWLYRVIRNAALADVRNRARRVRRENRSQAERPWYAAADDRIDADEAARLLSELPLEQREVVVARIWGGLTFDEIARVAECSLPTAYRRYRAGLSELKERLEGRWKSTTPTLETT